MAKAARGALKVVGAVASIVALIPGPWQAPAAAIAAVATVGSALLAKSARPSAGGSPTEFKLDRDAGIPFVVGRMFHGGNVVHRETWGKDNQYQGFIVVYSGGGPMQAFEKFTVDYSQQTFGVGGAAVGGLNGWLWQTTQLGLCPEAAALASPVAGFPGWGATSKLSGYGASALVFKFDTKGKQYSAGLPRTGWVGIGPKVYDPRQDGTFPGGLGPCRFGQEETYVGGEATYNPYLQAVTFAIGRWQNGKRVLGVGLAATAIDMQSVVESANIADANGFKCGGIIYSTDDKWNVLKAMCQAGGGQPMRLGAKLSFFADAPRVSLGTIEESDIRGKSSVKAAATTRDRVNGVIPKYRDEAQGWEEVPAAVVRVPAYVAQDGGEETTEVQYPLVQNAAQASKLAAYEIVNRREYGPISLSLRLSFLGYRPGDCLTCNLPTLGPNNQPAIVRRRALNAEDSSVSLDLVSETPSKHAFALGQNGTAPPAPALAGPDASIVDQPLAGQWLAVGGVLSAGGQATPAIVVYGSTDNTAANAVLFEIRRVGSAEWLSLGLDPVTMTRKQITDVVGGADYEVAVSYRVRGVIGARRILDAVSTGSAVAGSAADVGVLGRLDELYFGSPALKESSGGVAATLSAFKTSLGTANAIAGQGALATRGDVYFGSSYVLESAGGSQATLPAFKTVLGTANAIAGQGSLATKSTVTYGTGDVSGFGALAARANARLGFEVYRADGLTVAAEAQLVTSLGTANAIAGQGSLATKSTVTYGTGDVSGFGTMAARTNARLGFEVYRADGATVASEGALVTSLGTANAIAGQGALATRTHVYFGGPYLKEADSGTDATLSAFKTSLGTANAISGQGALATKSAVAYGTSDVSGFGTLAARATARLGFEVYRADGSTVASEGALVTSLGTANAIAGQGALATKSAVAYGTSDVSGFGSLAARSNARLGTEVYRSDGVTIASEGALVTSLGTANAIAGQGALATKSAVAYGTSDVSGFGTLAARATARLGFEVYRADGSTVASEGALVTSLGTANAIAGQGSLATKSTVTYGTGDVSGFGTLAARATARLGFEVYRADGSTVASEGALVTSFGTANAIAGQGAFATLSTADYSTRVSGAGKPAPYGTANISFSVTKVGVLAQEGNSFLFTVAGGENAEWIASDQPIIGPFVMRFRHNAVGQVYVCFTPIKSGWAGNGGFGAWLNAGVSSAHNWNGDPTGITWAYAAGNVHEIAWDGRVLRYLVEGVVKRSLTTALGSTPYFFEAIFNNPSTGCRLYDLEFLPANDKRVYRDDATTVAAQAEFLTAFGTANAIAGQGSLATKSTVTYGTGDVSGFGTLAARGTARLGFEVYRADGSTVASEAALVTSFGTANAIAGQGALATKTTADLETDVSNKGRIGYLDAAGKVTSPTAFYNTAMLAGPSDASTLAVTYTVGGSNVTVNIPAHDRKTQGVSAASVFSLGAGGGVVAFSALWHCYLTLPVLANVPSPSYQFTTNKDDLLVAGRLHVASGVAPAANGTGGTWGDGGGGDPDGGRRLEIYQ